METIAAVAIGALLLFLILYWYKKVPKAVEPSSLDLRILDREQRLLKLYQNLEDLMDSFEVYVEEEKAKMSEEGARLRAQISMERAELPLRSSQRYEEPPYRAGQSQRAKESTHAAKPKQTPRREEPARPKPSMRHEEPAYAKTASRREEPAARREEPVYAPPSVPRFELQLPEDDEERRPQRRQRRAEALEPIPRATLEEMMPNSESVPQPDSGSEAVIEAKRSRRLAAATFLEKLNEQPEYLSGMATRPQALAEGTRAVARPRKLSDKASRVMQLRGQGADAEQIAQELNMALAEVLLVLGVYDENYAAKT